MRFRRRSTKPTEVCQNCRYGNNDLGKYIKTWKRRSVNIGVDENDNLIEIDKIGFWHIFCEKKMKFRVWDCRKRCFVE